MARQEMNRVSVEWVYFDYLKSLNPHGDDVENEWADEAILIVARALEIRALGEDLAIFGLVKILPQRCL